MGKDKEIGKIEKSEFERIKRLVIVNGNPEYEGRLLQFFEYLEAIDKSISEETIQHFIELKIDHGYADKTGVQKHYKAEGIRGYQFAIKHLLKLLLEHSPNLTQLQRFAISNWLRNMKMSQISQDKKQVGEDKVLSPDEVRELIDGAGEKVSLFIEFLAVTGCRISDMCQIELGNCEPINGHYNLTVVYGKGSKERDLRISREFFERIRSHFAGKMYLFETSKGKPYHRSYVYREIQKNGAKILGKSIYPHMLRHSFATNMLQEYPEDLPGISAYLGHSDPAVTARLYIHGKLGFDKLNGYHDKLKGEKETG